MSFSVLLSRSVIAERLQLLGAEISKDYSGQKSPILLVGVLRGSFIFLADLVRKIQVPCEIDFIEVSSYGSGTVTSGSVQLRRDLRAQIKDRNVILVEDIVDTGHTVKFLKEHIQKLSPKSLKICSLLDKPSRRQVQASVDYIGFSIEDHFVVGYGLDFDDKYRQIPDVVIYDPKKETL